MRTCAGLSDDQLRRRAVPSSNLTLLGLVRHLAGVERWYFQAVIAGEFPGSLYTETDDPDEDFNDIESRPVTRPLQSGAARSRVPPNHRQVAAGSHRDGARRSGRWAAGTSHQSAGRQYSLRWVLNHMIDEYARHNGHADMIREAIDGETGE